MTHILSAHKGPHGMQSTTVKIWTVDGFFNQSVPDRHFNWEYYYTIDVDSGKGMTLLTKKRLNAEFKRYEDTPVYHAIMEMRWRR